MIPLRDNLIVSLDESLPNRAGLHIPTDTKKWKYADTQISNAGTVVVAGEGRLHPKTGTLLKTQCSAGDRIRFSQIQYPSFWYQSKKYLVINDQDVVGIEA